MSYGLSFWKYKSGVTLNHQEVCEKLSDGDFVEGLEDLPISIITEQIELAFSQYFEKLDEFTWESDNGGFQMYVTPQFLHFDCYQMTGDDMNKIIDIANKYGCPLFDPQEGRRYDG